MKALDGNILTLQTLKITYTWVVWAYYKTKKINVRHVLYVYYYIYRDRDEVRKLNDDDMWCIMSIALPLSIPTPKMPPVLMHKLKAQYVIFDLRIRISTMTWSTHSHIHTHSQTFTQTYSHSHIFAYLDRDVHSSVCELIHSSFCRKKFCEPPAFL